MGDLVTYVIMIASVSSVCTILLAATIHELGTLERRLRSHIFKSHVGEADTQPRISNRAL